MINDGCDGHFHIIPEQESSMHLERESCWCSPVWYEENKKEYLAGIAHKKVFVHKSAKELEQ